MPLPKKHQQIPPRISLLSTWNCAILFCRRRPYLSECTGSLNLWIILIISFSVRNRTRIYKVYHIQSFRAIVPTVQPLFLVLVAAGPVTIVEMDAMEPWNLKESLRNFWIKRLGHLCQWMTVIYAKHLVERLIDSRFLGCLNCTSTELTQMQGWILDQCFVWSMWLFPCQTTWWFWYRKVGVSSESFQCWQFFRPYRICDQAWYLKCCSISIRGRTMPSMVPLSRAVQELFYFFSDEMSP